MIFREDKGTGYMYCYNPSCFAANSSGKVLEHVYVMAKLIGRKLVRGEVVHHIDRNKKNNDPANLMLLTDEAHRMLHAVEDYGYEVKEVTCLNCKNVFKVSSIYDRKYCSSFCSETGRKQFDINKDELEKLVWQMPTTEIAKIYNVSDVAIAKRCKKFGITKPPRGYWAKVLKGKAYNEEL